MKVLRGFFEIQLIGSDARQKAAQTVVDGAIRGLTLNIAGLAGEAVFKTEIVDVEDDAQLPLDFEDGEDS